MLPKYKILSLTAALVFAADQCTKYLIQILVPRGASIPILPGLFDIVHIRNKGAAFGLFSSLPDSTRIPLFYVTSAIAVILLLLYVISLKEKRRGPYLSLGLILGGAFGNITDRLLRDEVIDFLSLHWYDAWVNWKILNFSLHFKLEWPSFNVADSAITVAVVWLFLDILFSQKGHPIEISEKLK